MSFLPEPEAVADARRLTARQLGNGLEQKATDAFCLTYARGQLRPLREGLIAETSLLPTVLELAVEPEPTAVIGRSSVSAESASQELIRLAPTLAAADRSFSLLARQVLVRDSRDGFYRRHGVLRAHLDRASAAVESVRLGRPPVAISAAPVQSCWLNNTIRVVGTPSVIADVAHASVIDRIDVPRRLRRESLDVTVAEAATTRASAGVTGRAITVGVIDGEVALSHPALGNRVIQRRNYTHEAFGNPDSHGTAIAGLIAADSPGFTGIAPGALIYNYKVFATVPVGSGDDFDAALALQHALEDGMRIVNCSWGTGPAGDGTSREARACDAAWAKGLMIVKSAGNDGPGTATLTTPADAAGVLVVGATTTDGSAVPEYSSRGPTTDGRRRPSVLAPGGDLGAFIDAILVGGGTGDLGDAGTSYAAPHVSGLIALLLEREPDLTPDQQRDRIIAASNPVPGAPADAAGSGLVSATKLLSPSSG